MRKSIYNSDNKLLRELLIEARNASGLSQAGLAKRLKKPQSFVSKYETGERRLDVIEFIEIAKALGIDPVKIVKKIAAK